MSSTHGGFTRPLIRSGTAVAKTFCLSAIDDELSIMKSSRSILLTALCVSRSTTVEVVTGSIGSMGRFKHPLTPLRPTTATPTAPAAPSFEARAAMRPPNSD